MHVGQAARTGLLRERESDNGPFRRSRLLRSTLAGTRCGDATPAEGSRPPGSSGARRRGPSVGPTRVWSSGFWSRGTVVYSTAPGPVAPLSRSDLGRKTGCTRVRPGLRLLSRSIVRLVRPVSAEASSTRPLQDQAMGASGQSRWRQRPCLRTRQRSKALRPADASGVGTRSSQLCLRPAQRPEPARRYRPSVTTGRLLTRETLRRVGHDRGRS
jgi:hypothetical protein